jgi:TM2 domain-containing membrane protein YozV
MMGQRHELPRLQSDFYRDKYRNILRALLVSFLIIVILICWIIYLVLFREPAQYYATTIEGKIITLTIKPKQG